MNIELGKGILNMLFKELIAELSDESIRDIAEKVAAEIRVYEICHESHIRKIMEIDDLEKQADIANRFGDMGQALRKQIEAEDLRLTL